MIYITTYPITQRINPMRKPLLTTAAVAAMITLPLAVAAWADMMPELSYEPPPWKSGATIVTLNKDDGTLRVSGNGPMDDYDAYDLRHPGNRAPWHIPGVYYRVINAVAPITAAVFEEGVTHIGDWAFSAEHDLRSVTIPASVSSIGKNAFWNNHDLKSITVAADNTHYCSVDGVLFNKDKTVLIQYPGGIEDSAYAIPNNVTIIGRNAFYGARVKSVTISNGVTSIEKQAFSFCQRLTSITIPGNVKTIGEDAFADCPDLVSVTIEDGETAIEDGAFYGCTGLTSVSIGNGAKRIGKKAFLGCRSLMSVTIGSGAATIDDDAFRLCEKLTSVTIGNGVTHIGAGVFSRCKNLTSVTLPKSVNHIGEFAFAECDGLMSIKVFGNVRYIGESAFAGCDNLATVTIPSGVTEIKHKMFFGCRNLKTVTIPKSVTYIGSYAFMGCPSLTSVILQNPRPPEVDSYAFIADNWNPVNMNWSRTDLYVPISGFFAYRASDTWLVFGSVKPVGVTRFALCLLATVLMLSAAVFVAIKRLRKLS